MSRLRSNSLCRAGVVVWLAAVLIGGCTETPLDPIPAYAENEQALFSLAPEGESLPYLILGDWGRRGSLFQDDVAAQLSRTAETINSRFVISTGDNFYDNGVKSVDDSHWQESFERIYTHTALMPPWYVTLGNHDYKGNVQAQIDYSRHSHRWTLPAAYYLIEQDLDDTTSVRFVFIDTEAIREHPVEAPRQLRWLDNTLATSTADWLIVVGHHPIYSGGYHGDDAILIDEVKPILDTHGVDAYFSGHDHDLQHLYDGRLHYFVSGAGSKLRETGRHRFTQFGITRPGFMAASMTASHLTVRFIDHLGNTLYGAQVVRQDKPALAAN